MSYIQEENLKYLSEFKYSTTGYSKFDLVMNYFWEWVVNLLPMWLAPNLITVIGLVFMITSYVIMTFYDTTFERPIPGGVLILSAICQFLYQTLDAVDGKQARRTGQSSPLGMLLDHGCDSLSTNLLALALIQGLGLGITCESLILMISILTGFYLATWEEYHTHTCRTQMFNWGVTESQFLNMFLLIATAFLGKDFWNTSIGYANLKTLLIAINVIMMAFLAGTIAITTFMKTTQTKQALITLVPILVIDLNLALWFNNDLLKEYGHFILLLHGVVFSGVCEKLIISSVSRQQFSWVHADVFLSLLFLVQDFIGILPRLPALCVLSIFLLIHYSAFVVRVVLQISNYLEISVFFITKEKSK